MNDKLYGMMRSKKYAPDYLIDSYGLILEYCHD